MSEWKTKEQLKSMNKSNPYSPRKKKICISLYLITMFGILILLIYMLQLIG